MKYPIEIACIIDDDDMYVNLITKVLDIKNLVKNLLIFKNGKEALDYFVRALKLLEERKNTSSHSFRFEYACHGWMAVS